MRVTRFDNQRNLTELVTELFELEDTPGTLAAARAALDDANPDLGLRGGRLDARLDPGRLIRVPDVEHATHTASSTALGDEAVRVLIERARRVMAAVDAGLEESSQRTVELLDARLARLRSAPFQDAAAADPSVEERIRFLDETTTASMDAVAVQRGREVAAMNQIADTIGRLAQLLS